MVLYLSQQLLVSALFYREKQPSNTLNSISITFVTFFIALIDSIIQSPAKEHNGK